MNLVKFEQMISYHPDVSIPRDGTYIDQPTLRDMIFDYYCGVFKNDADRANKMTKAYLDDIAIWLFCDD